MAGGNNLRTDYGVYQKPWGEWVVTLALPGRNAERVGTVWEARREAKRRNAEIKNKRGK